MGYSRENLKGFYKRTTVFYVLLIKRLIEKTRPGTTANFLAGKEQTDKQTDRQTDSRLALFSSVKKKTDQNRLE